MNAWELLGVPMPQAALLVGLIFLRVVAFVASAPVLADMRIPVRVKLALGLALTALLVPLIPPGPLPNGAALLAGVISETLLGLFWGGTIGFTLIALKMAGSVIANAVSLSQLFAGADPEPLPVVGNLLLFAGLALACMAGLPIQLVAFLALSFEIAPPGHVPAPDTVLQAAVMSAEVIVFAVQLALPVLALSLIYNLSLGAINRVMPQLMVVMIGAPALSAGVLLLLLLLLEHILVGWIGFTFEFLERVLVL